VPIEVVRRQVQQRADIRPEFFNQLQLEAASTPQLLPIPQSIFSTSEISGVSHIAGKMACIAAGLQDVMNQRSGCGFFRSIP